MKKMPDLGEPRNRLACSACQHVEGHKLTHRQLAGNDQAGSEIQNARHDGKGDRLHIVAGGIAEPQDTKARGHIAGKPTALPTVAAFAVPRPWP